MEFDTAQFVTDRNAAMLSLDREQIETFAREWGAPIHPDEEKFWASVHKTRTAIPALPHAARIESKRWLTARGLTSLDDGDLTEQETADGAR